MAFGRCCFLVSFARFWRARFFFLDGLPRRVGFLDLAYCFGRLNLIAFAQSSLLLQRYKLLNQIQQPLNLLCHYPIPLRAVTR